GCKATRDRETRQAARIAAQVDTRDAERVGGLKRGGGGNQLEGPADSAEARIINYVAAYNLCEVHGSRPVHLRGRGTARKIGAYRSAGIRGSGNAARPKDSRIIVIKFSGKAI